MNGLAEAVKSPDHGTYIGPRKELRGKTAILWAQNTENWEAQFDDASLVDETTGAMLGYGWHKFPTKDFQVDLEDSNAG